MEHITLYYRQGPSDKVYQAGIEAQNGGCVVNFAYGRRGTALQTGTKTQTPVAYADAKKIYDKLVAEKQAKGYSPSEEGTPYQNTEHAKEISGIHCQLLNPIDEAQAVALIHDRTFCMQEKFDGQRKLLRKQGAAIEGINRNGLITGIPSVLVNELRNVPDDVVIDGECVGEEFFAFDLLSAGETDARQWPYQDRYISLINLFAGRSIDHILLAETAFDPASKADMLERLRQENREGVVFKKVTAAYTPGRPASGGDQFKCKFYETASFIVAKINDRRSVTLNLLSGKRLVCAGNVTIPPNRKVPEPGEIVEVRYLYAFKESGSIYQPVYLGGREDIEAAACTVNQLKYKAPC